jgi:hypothetical protein
MVHSNVFLFIFFTCQLLNRSQIEKREYFSRMLLLFEFHPHPPRGLCSSLWLMAKSFAFAPPALALTKRPECEDFARCCFR